MDLFCFASDSIENIRISCEHRKWALSITDDPVTKGRTTKARKRFRVGSMGILYSNDKHSFTVPFIARSMPNSDSVVENVWRGRWALPFDIEPLGSPQRLLHKDVAKRRWPFVERHGVSCPISISMRFVGRMVFVPVEISEDDWNLVLSDLANPTPGIYALKSAGRPLESPIHP